MKAKTMTIEDCQRTAQKTWIVFLDQTDMPWLKLLKKGYRHCFVLIHDGTNWVSIDPMAHYMDVIVHHVDGDFDFPEWLTQRGHEVVQAKFEGGALRASPFMPFSCVEVCKRVLGIRHRMIITPWALYKHITRDQSLIDTRPFLIRAKDYLKQTIKKGITLWEA
ncbi:MAG: hypothetical protein ACRBCK_04505 [Alphaproteobacteria bacterium]